MIFYLSFKGIASLLLFLTERVRLCLDLDLGQSVGTRDCMQKNLNCCETKGVRKLRFLALLCSKSSILY